MKGMVCENMGLKNIDSEMEEGEIVDDLDDLSDISSEEEYLLRQRLQVLENFNKVLERKKKKRSSLLKGRHKEDDYLSHDLSEVSATELEETFPQITSKANVVVYSDHRHLKSHHKQKKKKDIDLNKESGKNKESKKKSHRKKKLGVKVISESSDESEDEYRNKRRKLADAVAVNKDKNDKSTLQTRLQKMLSANTIELKPISTVDKETETDSIPKLEDSSCSPIVPNKTNVLDDDTGQVKLDKEIIQNQQIIESVDLSTDDDVVFVNNEMSHDTTDSIIRNQVDINNEKTAQDTTDLTSKNQIDTKKETDSDEDLELLRQHALKSKASKTKTEQIANADAVIKDKQMSVPEDEDSDTVELRVICLKSALLKKAIETKKKLKLKKRLSQSITLQDELLKDQEELMNKIESENNNTDIESVDMDIGSDVEDRGKEYSTDVFKNNDSKEEAKGTSSEKNVLKVNVPKEDELEEDEDLLRARLLTSLSKNLPTLVDPKVLDNIEKVESTTSKKKPNKPTNKTTVPVEKRLVINVGESDSEAENEATKNLTKMHMKLVEHNKTAEPVNVNDQNDFQQKLDMFLKSTRMKVERTRETDPHKPTITKTDTKKQIEDSTLSKAVSNLPKSAQIEYKKLVKKMAELEKLKQARQSTVNLLNKVQTKDTLKPRNVSVDSAKLAALNQLEEQIALSRKNIAEESAKMLKLKEEATKLSQKYKIVATELRNISTAITLNKKEQKTVQNKLTKIRIQHQKLLNSTTSIHSKTNGQYPVFMPNKSTKMQKENDMLKSFQAINDVNKSIISHPRLPVISKVDMNSNRNFVANAHAKDEITDVRETRNNTDHMVTEQNENKLNCSLPKVNEGGGDIKRNNESTSIEDAVRRKEKGDLDDYESPLQALSTASWEGDPHGILCPFEVSGCCKDSECKYLHPKLPTQP